MLRKSLPAFVRIEELPDSASCIRAVLEPRLTGGIKTAILRVLFRVSLESREFKLVVSETKRSKIYLEIIIRSAAPDNVEIPVRLVQQLQSVFACFRELYSLLCR